MDKAAGPINNFNGRGMRVVYYNNAPFRDQRKGADRRKSINAMQNNNFIL